MCSSDLYKSPVSGEVSIGFSGVIGDAQGDQKNHGGPDNAVYAYSADHYAAWRREEKRDDLHAGFFGENLTVAALREKDVRIGDLYRVGHVLLEVTQPRLPCATLGVRFGDKEFPDRFQTSLRTGMYLRVLLHGIAPVPAIPDEIRSAARRRMEQLGHDAFRAELAQRDAESAAAIKPNDLQRLVRAWEVVEATGTTLPAWQRQGSGTGFAGPLAGLHAALSAASHPLVATAPCDSPFLPTDVVARLHEAMSANDAQLTVAKTGEQAHPVFCLCRRDVLPHLEQFLAGGGRKIDLWYATLRVIEVNFDDVAEAFSNINSPQELAAFEQTPPR